MLSVLNSTQLNSTTSIRPLVHSYSYGQLLWTDVGLSTTRQERAATRFCVTVHSREHPLRRASACGRPNWAWGYNQERPFEKKKKLTHCSTTLRKNGCISSHGDTQRNEKPLLNSAPEQAERPETHHRLPTPHSIPLAILEMMLPSHAIVKKKPWKKHQPKSIRESPR